MEHQANTTPEAVIESVPNEPPVEPERKPLKPGKWYGIFALLCGAEGLPPILAFFLTHLLISSGVIGPRDVWNIWIITVSGLFFINPLCVIAGIVFGIRGRNTEGRLYAYTGLVLSVLCGLTTTPIAMFLAYHMLFPCC